MRKVTRAVVTVVLVASGLFRTTITASAGGDGGQASGEKCSGAACITVTVKGSTHEVKKTPKGKKAGSVPAVTCTLSSAAPVVLVVGQQLPPAPTLSTGDLQSRYDQLGGTPVLVHRSCSDGTWTTTTWSPGVAVPVFTGRQLADRAAAQLPTPAPQMRSDPPSVSDGAGRAQWVNYPVFYGMENWDPVSTTASAGGLTATATATPVQLIIDTHSREGTIRCNSSGQGWPDRSQVTDWVPFSENDPVSDCFVRFTQSSNDHAPLGSPTQTKGGQVTTNYSDGYKDWVGSVLYPVEFTAVWHLTWSATDGTSGDLGYDAASIERPELVMALQSRVISHEYNTNK